MHIIVGACLTTKSGDQLSEIKPILNVFVHDIKIYLSSLHSVGFHVWYSLSLLEQMIPYFSQLKLCCCQSLAGTKLGFLELVAFICNYENNDKFTKLSDNFDIRPRNRNSMLNIARIANAVRVTFFSLFSQCLSNFSKRSFKIYYCPLVFDGC